MLIDGKKGGQNSNSYKSKSRKNIMKYNDWHNDTMAGAVGQGTLNDESNIIEEIKNILTN